MKKQILTKEAREKMIVESFANNFNKIKRIGEDDIYGEKHYNVNSPGQRPYYKNLISKYFGPENKYRGSADWGGMPVWTVKGNEFEGTFILLDDNDNIVLMTRKFDEATEENIDNVIDQTDGEDLESVMNILKQALQLKNNMSELGISEENDFQNPIDKAHSEYQSPSDRMYASDDWVKAQQNAGEDADRQDLGEGGESNYDAIVKQYSDFHRPELHFEQNHDHNNVIIVLKTNNGITVEGHYWNAATMALPSSGPERPNFLVIFLPLNFD